MSAEAYLRRVAEACASVLDLLLADAAVPPELREAMRHSVAGGGKRLRPALLLAAAEACGAAEAMPRLLPAAAAFELLHTYSLIHDDLPAMDDALLRRGRPACHRVFGEATALLAGDALQALAFAALAGPLPGVAPAAQLAAVADFARAAGPAGMCGGQALDLAADRQPPDDAGLFRLQAMKTGALISAAAAVGARLAGAGAEDVAALAEYGGHLGAAFQITDDVLDVTGGAPAMGKDVGGDAAGGKTTFAARFGVPAARRMAAEAVARAEAALAPLSGDTGLLRALARFSAERDR